MIRYTPYFWPKRPRDERVISQKKLKNQGMLSVPPIFEDQAIFPGPSPGLLLSLRLLLNKHS